MSASLEPIGKTCEYCAKILHGRTDTPKLCKTLHNLGRRNFLFSGSHYGAQRSAMLYSFMGTCKLHGINPMIWMVDVLKKITNNPPVQIQELLPHEWKKINKVTLGDRMLPLVPACRAALHRHFIGLSAHDTLDRPPP